MQSNQMKTQSDQLDWTIFAVKIFYQLNRFGKLMTCRDGRSIIAANVGTKSNYIRLYVWPCLGYDDKLHRVECCAAVSECEYSWLLIDGPIRPKALQCECKHDSWHCWWHWSTVLASAPNVRIELTNQSTHFFVTLCVLCAIFRFVLCPHSWHQSLIMTSALCVNIHRSHIC